VKISDKDCLLDDTSADGASGSSATTIAPGVPGIFSLVAIMGSLSFISSGSDILLEAVTNALTFKAMKRFTEQERSKKACIDIEIDTIYKGISSTSYFVLHL